MKLEELLKVLFNAESIIIEIDDENGWEHIIMHPTESSFSRFLTYPNEVLEKFSKDENLKKYLDYKIVPDSIIRLDSNKLHCLAIHIEKSDE